MCISESQRYFLLSLKINLMELVNIKVYRISLHIYQHTKQLSNVVNCRKNIAEIYQLYTLQNSSLKLLHPFDQIPGKCALMDWQSGISMLWSFWCTFNVQNHIQIFEIKQLSSVCFLFFFLLALHFAKAKVWLLCEFVDNVFLLNIQKLFCWWYEYPPLWSALHQSFLDKPRCTTANTILSFTPLFLPSFLSTRHRVSYKKNCKGCSYLIMKAKSSSLAHPKLSLLHGSIYVSEKLQFYSYNKSLFFYCTLQSLLNVISLHIYTAAAIIIISSISYAGKQALNICEICSKTCLS